MSIGFANYPEANRDQWTDTSRLPHCGSQWIFVFQCEIEGSNSTRDFNPSAFAAAWVLIHTGCSTSSVVSHHLPNKNDSAYYLSVSVFKVITTGCIILLESFQPLEKCHI
jgi:hypothetical protein